jgi:hypothetical protein
VSTSESSSATTPLANLGDASGDLVLAGALLLTWIAPDAAWAVPLRLAMLTMLLEFIVLHSTAFMGTVAYGRETRGKRALAILALGGFYTLFVAGFALAFEMWQPLLAFWLLTLNRSLGVLFHPAPSAEQELRIRKGWAATTMAYLAAVGLTTLLPVPALGIEPSVVAAAELPASGLWVDEPQRVVAAGVVHFSLSGASALFDHRWISDRSIPRRPA